MDMGQDVYLERIAVALERLAAFRQPSRSSGAAIPGLSSDDAASLQGLKADVAEIKTQLTKVMELMTTERGEVVKEVYTVDEVAKRTKYRPFTIRQACNTRRIAGAYKARDNAWRIPHAAVIDIINNGLPPAVLELPARDQQLIADFRDLVLTRLGLLGFAVLDARLDGSPVSMFVGIPACGSPTKGLISFVVRSMNKLAVEFGRSVGDRDFPRRLKAAFKRKRPDFFGQP